MATILGTLLNKSDESRRSYFVPGITGKASSFLSLSMVLVVGFFVHVLHQVEMVLLYY